jgi:radical SAM superfamily enzyme YgiQ (UPF0313 family)
MSISIAIIDFKSVLTWLNISNAELICSVKNSFPDTTVKHIHQLANKNDFIPCDINIFHIDYYTIGIANELIADITSSANSTKTKFMLYGYGVFYDDSFNLIDERIEIFPKDDLNPVLERLSVILHSNLTCYTSLIADYSLLPIESIQNYPIRTTLGCVNSCPFCEKSLNGIQQKSIKEIEKEILLAKELYNIKALTFWDSSMNFSIVRFRNILKLLQKIGLPWRSNGMLYKNLTRDLICEMQDSGCYLTSLGVESTDITVNSGKKFDLNQYSNVCTDLKKYGILNLSFFIIGLENDTYSKSLKTIKDAQNFEIDVCLFASAIAYPRTELYKHVIDCGGLFLVDYRNINLQSENIIHFETPYFRKTEREKVLKLSESFNINNKATRKQTEDRFGFPYTSSAEYNIKWKD